MNRLEEIVTSKEEVLKRCSYILVNQVTKFDRPYVRRPINQTLELRYKVDISDVLENARIALEEPHIERIGLTEEELYEYAYRNTMKKFPYKLQSLTDALGCSIFESKVPLYVLTNETTVNGAGVILYEGMRDILLDAVENEFIAIPSSIHEWIIVPEILRDVGTITKMIQEVNSTVVSPNEVLSDRPYELVADGELYEL